MAWRLFFSLFLAASLISRVQAQDQTAFFEKSIRPVLVEHCIDCHGPAKQRAGLRLDSREAMIAGGDTGPALVPGNPATSLMIKALAHKDEPRMPPKGRLTGHQIEALTNWVKAGAHWPESKESRPVTKSGFTITPKDREFWAFQPVVKPAVPEVKNVKWPRQDLDRFILTQLEKADLKPAPMADRRTLIRRATFDLIGLPPTPAEVNAFLEDQSPDAFAKVIDRLLESPHYGERWARHWLDIARYGEDQAHTFAARKYPQGFRYRDWLIQAFNDDMPYNRFLTEQLAADLLGEGKDRVPHLAALGFFAVGPVYYGDPKKLDQIDDRIDTLTRGVLGLTVACARCHDHKFDPISSKDYYGLAGIFASTDYVELSLNPGMEGQPVPPPSKEKNAKPMDKGPFMHAIKDGPPVTMQVHLRGNPSTLGEQAPRRMMQILSAETEPAFTKGSGRLELAHAIANDQNPLTPRVFVNRLWQHHFGKALVRTPSNFGALGDRPTHPELLDFLAAKFVESGWSIKAMHRLMMLSATYQLSTEPSAKNAEVDGDNKLWWRANRRRLEVEAWRDAMLAVSDKLKRDVGGPSFDLADANNARRTLYGMVSRHELNALLRLFDFPDPNITSDERTTTTVPLQQLFVLNSDFLVNNAKALSARLQKIASTDEDRISEAFQILFSRPVSQRELDLGVAFLKQPVAAGTSLTRWDQYAQVLLSTNEFLYVD